jgi:hypothetical protein
MAELVLRAWILQQNTRARLWERMRRDERGEGVISAAIAVLIMAFLGVAMWIAFKATLSGATSNVNRQVTNIGQ